MHERLSQSFVSHMWEMVNIGRTMILFPCMILQGNFKVIQYWQAEQVPVSTVISMCIYVARW